MIPILGPFPTLALGVALAAPPPGAPGPVAALGPVLPDTVDVVLTEGTNMAVALRPGSGDLALDLVGRIWLQRAGEEEAIPLTDPVFDARQPAWSADGERIFFQAYLDGNWHIWSVDAEGGEPVRHTSGPFDDREPHLSDDGRWLAFSSDRGGSYDIWVMDLETGALEQRTSDPGEETNPAWSPGEDILFVSEQESGAELVILAPDGRHLRLPGSRLRADPVAPSYSPSGRRVGWVDLDPLEGGVFAHDLTGTEGPRRLSGPGEDVFPFRAGWSDDDRLIYTADGVVRERRLQEGDPIERPFRATVTLDRPAWTRRTRDFDSTTPRAAKGIVSPRISPDGGSVAFTALGDLWVQPVGGPAERLTDDAHLEADPAWSPDGTRLLFTSDRAGSMDLWVRDMATEAERRVTSEPFAEMAGAFSPDGGRIAYIAKGGITDPTFVRVVPVDGGDPITLEDGTFAPGRPTWSADGRHVAVSALEPFSTAYREGVSVVRVYPSDGSGGPRIVGPWSTVSLGPRGTSGPVWSPDGGHMAYSAGGVLWLVPVHPDGTPKGEPVRLTDELAENPSWTADSRHIAYLSVDRVKRIDLATSRTVTLMEGPIWSPAHPTGRTVVHAGAVWDGLSDELRRDVDIVVEGHRIAAVAPHADAHHAAGRVVDASDGVVIPGLIEMHAHQDESFGESLGRMLLAWGITSVREPATDPYESIERREAMRAGRRIAPRVFQTGYMMDGSRVYYDLGQAIEPGVQLERELDRAAALGYDLVKTYVRFPDPLQQRVIEGAHARGMWVSSHEIYPAVAYGGDGVEHIRGTSRRGYSPKVTSMWSATYQDIVALLTASGMTITPTLALSGGMWELGARDPALFEDERLGIGYPSEGLDALSARIGSLEANEVLTGRVRNMQRFVREVVRGGGRVVAGTDAPILPFGASLLAEIELYAEGGLTPLEALRTATTVAADALGESDDLGALARGMLADLVILDEDPLTDIRALRTVRAVMVDGRFHDRASLAVRPGGDAR